MDKKFCINLKNARKFSGLTQKDVARHLGVVESCYANWEQGRTEPNIEALRQLSHILDISLDELINGETDPL
ncbi:MAG: helix-turn-helix transcriptional regulator [Clostridia bacterium]|nr:helix-turn-helix transcriptional regulator [Clostridia bacterium]